MWLFSLLDKNEYVMLNVYECRHFRRDKMKFQIAYHSDIGNTKKVNQDAIGFKAPEITLIAKPPMSVLRVSFFIITQQPFL